MHTFYYIPDSNSIMHHGIKGQHWGERRYQHVDGTWTEEGKARRRNASKKEIKYYKRKEASYNALITAAQRCMNTAVRNPQNGRPDPWSDPTMKKAANNYMKYAYPEIFKNKKSANRKVILGMAVVGTAGTLALVATTGYIVPALFPITNTSLRRLPSIQEANREYLQARNDIISVAWEQVSPE